MRPRNRDGTPIDPVPFFVVAAVAFLLAFAFGPPYVVAAFGAPFGPALAGSACAFALLVGAAYYRLIWTASPAVRREVPAGRRLRRLLYAALAAAFLFALLALPLF